MQEPEKKVEYCGRNVGLMPYFALAASEEEFLWELHRMGIDPASTDPWVGKGGGRTYFFLNEGREVALVAMNGADAVEHDQVAVMGLLVHEAAHIWQRVRRNIGEHDPSDEFEAYYIQHISQQLIQSWMDQEKHWRKVNKKEKRRTKK